MTFEKVCHAIDDGPMQIILPVNIDQHGSQILEAGQWI